MNKYIHWPIQGGCQGPALPLGPIWNQKMCQGNRLVSSPLWGWRPPPQSGKFDMKRLFHCCTGRSPFKFAQKKLWREAGEACLLAQCLHLMADEYVKASEKFVLPSANQLTRFALPSSSRSAHQLLRELKVISSIFT